MFHRHIREAFIRLLFFHNAYQQRGGEDLVVESEIAMLKKGGHEVELVTVSNHEIAGAWSKAQLLWRTAYNPESYNRTREAIRAFRPDVVHVHNFFPLLTPAVHEAAAQAGVGVVQTLHNYRMLCAAATFERNGTVCEDCLTGGKYNALRHRCYRGSLPATAALVNMQRSEAKHGRVARLSDRLICLTAFARDKFAENGWPKNKLVVKPNFLDRSDLPKVSRRRRGVLFVGRLSHEKGVHLLLEAWRSMPAGTPLRIAGDGPMAETLTALGGPNVTFLGRVDAAQVQQEMLSAELLVVPSLWYEGFPMIIVEAFSCGLPVAASGHGSLAEIIVPGRNGEHFVPGDAASLAAIMSKLLAAPNALTAMGVAAREDFRELYSAERNLLIIEAIYDQAVNAAASRRSLRSTVRQAASPQ